jgi:hypothetical protein
VNKEDRSVCYGVIGKPKMILWNEDTWAKLILMRKCILGDKMFNDSEMLGTSLNIGDV